MRRNRPQVSPLRILIVAPSLDILGGQAVQARLLLQRLSCESGLDVALLPINPRLPGVFRYLQRIKYIRTIATSLVYLASLLVRVRKYDVVHIFSASYFSFVLAQTPAILVARLYRKKVVLNYRSGQAEDHLKSWRTALPTIRLCDAVVVPSGYLVDVFGRFNVPARPIFNIVDTRHFQFRSRQPARPLFVCNRNLEKLYNVGCILRAFALIQKSFPDASLLVAGDGSQRRDLELLAKQLHLRNTTFLGRVPHREMNALYDRCDVYLNGSDIDNMPGSIIEAFASGLPVVTTDAGGIPYIVTDGKTGLMVRRGDYVAMAKCGMRLIEDAPLAERVSTAARAECAKYSWQAVRRQWIDLYEELAGLERETFQSKEQPALVAPPNEVVSRYGIHNT